MAVRHILFDLDNTLYPARTGLMAEMDRRVAGYLARALGVSLRRAQRVQAEYCWQYGSCAPGLLRHAPLDLDRFLTHVHDLDVRRYLRPDPALAQTLDSLPARKWVFTNAPGEHAHRVLEALDVADRFDGIFDIRVLEFVGKPDPAAYRRVLAALDVAGPSCAMVDDAVRNLRPAKALGIGTVLVAGPGARVAPWVDVWLDDLTRLPEAVQTLSTRNSRRPRRSSLP
jgi:putative hydrolase of the HAD superfamily